MLTFLKPYEWLIGLIILLLLVVGLWGFGAREFRKGVLEQLGKDKAAALVVQTKGEAVSTKVETRYITRVQVIHDAGTTIIKKVPIYVTHEDSSRCVVNNGFVQLWNDANKMQLSNASPLSYAKASSVVLTDIATQHVREANLYHQQYEQLKALQDWVTQEQKAYK
jgi:hypothetical protein